MKYILNSAVITAPGLYRYHHVPLESAIAWLRAGRWVSTIGYRETAEALERLTGISIPVNRRQIKMEPGDTALVFRLTCRLDDPRTKGVVGVDFIREHSEIGILRKEKK